MPVLIRYLLVVCIVALGAASNAGESRVPAAVVAAMNALPSEAQPQLLQRAMNGAIYARLPNGCEIIVMEKHSAPVVTVQGWVRTGGVNEAKFEGAGLSHFCEHMMFKGTTSRQTGVLDQEIRGAGGDDNAYTNAERTVYHITCQIDGFDTSFNVLADMLMNSTFPPDETVKEHSVVYKEIERYQDNPDGVLWETFEQSVYQVHPYRIPVLGYPDRFKRVTRDEVYAYYQERYSPDNACFITVGDFAAETVLPKMAKTLATWKRRSVEPAPIAEEPDQIAPRSITIGHPLCQVPKMVLGYPGIPERHADLYALDLLANILGDGRSSRLYREVRDKGLVLDISASDYTPMYKGYFVVNATVESKNIEAAKQAILKVLYDAKTVKPTPQEMARAKQKMKTARIMQQMTAEGVAGALGGDWFVAGDLDFSDRYVDRILEVSEDQVLEVARKYLLSEKLNVAVMLPKEEAAAKEPGQPDDPKAAAQLKASAAEKALQDELKALEASGAVEAVSLLPDKAVFEFRLKSNGVKVVLREDRSLPVVNIAVAALGGTRWEPAELEGSGHILAEILNRGTATRSKLKIAEESEDLGATIETFSGRSSFGLTTAGLKQDANKLMDLAADCMLHPSFPQDELDLLKNDTLQQIAMEDESLVTLNTKILRPLLWGNHPYARQSLGTPETVKKVGADDLKKLHQQWVHPENLAVGFCGDLSPLEALKLAGSRFGELKTGDFKPPAVPPVPELTKGESGESVKEGIKGAVLTLGFRSVNIKSPDRETLDLIAGILSGLGGRLNNALREKQGLAYSVGVFNDSQLDGGAIVFFIQTEAKWVNVSLEGMWKEVNVLRDTPVPEKELESVKNYLAGSEAIGLQNQSEVAQRLALSQLFGEGAAHVFSRKSRLEKVTPQALQEAARKYLNTEHWAKAVLRTRELTRPQGGL